MAGGAERAAPAAGGGEGDGSRAAMAALADEPLCTDVYSKSCKCKKGSPLCLAGLAPGPAGFRRKGLWQKDAQALADGGRDPAEDRREDAATPAGLNNLGNTCYVNGALQCLFMTPAFRRGLYAVEPPAADDEVVGHIRRLFAGLQAGAQASADPSALAASLQLDNSIQQDGQEFFKLLLSLLEGKLARSASEEVRSLVPRLFRGASAYETRCQVCQQLSESSQRATHFYELDVPVKGYSSLEESLAAMQEPELLCGPNQYFCSHCNAKADATRQLRLRSLPPFLCLSLQRFVFDLKKLAKVKATDKMSFPLRLDLRREAGGREYELAAILIHKGASASHGHYVAHVREEGSGRWWRCNDESVTPLPSGPMSNLQDLGVSAGKQGAAEKKGAGRAPGGRGGRGRKRAAGGDELGTTGSPSAAEPGAAARVLSSNAYMLLYRGRDLPHELSAPADGVQLPASLVEAVATANAEFVQRCQEHKAKVESRQQQVADRRSTVRQVLESAALSDRNQPFRFVSAAWLRKWVDSVEDLPADNTELLCAHGKMSPEKLKDAKVVSLDAWRALASVAGAQGPELGPNDICDTCTRQLDASARDQEASLQQRAEVLARIEADEACPPAPIAAFLVSKTWLTGWRKRSKQGGAGAAPTEGITCPHGGLLPEAAGPKARRAVVSRPVWDFLSASWLSAAAQEQAAAAAAPAGRPADDEELVVLEEGWEPMPAGLLSGPDAQANGSGAAPMEVAETNGGAALPDAAKQPTLQTFPAATSADCPECSRELAAGAAAGRDLREQLEQQKLALPMLLSGAGGRLDPGASLCLLPRAWLQRWRAFVGGGHRPQSAAAHPGSLAEALAELMCSCHRTTAPLLAFPPPSVTKRRGRWVAELDSAFEVASEQDGLHLLEQYAPEHELEGCPPYADGARHPRLIHARLEDCTADGQPAAASELPDQPVVLSEDEGPDAGAHAPVPGARQDGRAALRTWPALCAQAVAEREAAELAVRLDFRDAEFVVELVSRDALQEPPGERKSKRSRRGRNSVRLSSDTTLEGLRMVVAQALELHPLNTAIHARPAGAGAWELLAGDDSATLKDLRLLPDSELRVVSSGEHDDADLASYVPGGAAGARQAERGFAGTVLMGQAPGG